MLREKKKHAHELPDFRRFFPEVVTRLQECTDVYLDEFNEHAAFDYMTAEIFATTDEDQFEYTDGKNDHGIDFFTHSSQTYRVFQCKCPEIETLEEGGESAPTFGKKPVMELVSGINMLLDESGEYETSKAIHRLRSDYARDRAADAEATVLTGTVAVMGLMTEAGKKYFEAEKERLTGLGVTLHLLEWPDFYDAMHAMDVPADVDLEIDLHFQNADKEVLRQRDYCYLLAYAHDFYEAWREHEWSLFEWNVRLQQQNSPVNARIVSSLKTAKGRKIFHHLNNGITITCRSYSYDSTRKRIRLQGPQVINGCQTVCAIRDAYEGLTTPKEQEQFREQARVQVKIIKSTDMEFISSIVVSTNDQNPMNPRNLKSNTSEQKDIQKAFRDLPKKWFYERKDGEQKSLWAYETKPLGCRKSEYTMPGARTPRMLSNQELAQVWYAWIGLSDRVVKGGLKYFEDDELYASIFKSTPSDEWWHSLAMPAFKPNDDQLGAGVPSTYQYLIASACYLHAKTKRLSPKANRDAAIARGVESGSLEKDADGKCIASKEKIDKHLAQDTDYRVQIMINNMLPILVELYSFLLCKKYDTLDPTTCQQLVTAPELQAFLTYGQRAFSSEQVPFEKANLLEPIYAFLLYSMKQYYFTYEAEIQAAARLKAYFFDRKNVTQIREFVAQKDVAVKGYDVEWLLHDKGLVDSLPELEKVADTIKDRG